MIPETDEEYEDYVVEGVKLDADVKPARWVCQLQHGFSLALERRPGLQPREGDDLRVYGLLPTDVRGVVLRGKVAFYHTPEEWQAKLQAREDQWMEDLRELGRTYAEDYARAYDELPVYYRARIDKLREADPEFHETLEVRELMICQQAALIARVLRKTGGSPLDIETLRGLPTMRKLTDVVQWMVQDADLSGGLASTHTRKSLDTALTLATFELTNDLQSLVDCPAAGETVQDRHLGMTDCPFPELLRS